MFRRSRRIRKTDTRRIGSESRRRGEKSQVNIYKHLKFKSTRLIFKIF